MPGGRFGWLEQMVARHGREGPDPADPAARNQRRRAEPARQCGCCSPTGWPRSIDAASKRATIAISKANLDLRGRPDRAPAARAVAPEVLDKAIDHTLLARRCFAPMIPALQSGGSMVEVAMGRRRLAGPRTAAPRRADRQAGRRAVPARAWPASRNGRLARRALSQGACPRGSQPDDPIPAGLE